ncbi:zinc ribbon domain-containing protein [Mycobacterium intracellulare]|uniref:zinc ribbon domain-containing protein n=2 Tax=Mycobacterium avium complex (MAC) TaxID=120793 RepID=UPI0015557807|nr:zinc ribbon domain-containing protein [Mycobacterium intracellulare]UCN12784.1 transposase [Mycobacterium intracellulare subsp. chimaera]
MANPGKAAALRALFPECRSAMGHLAARARRELLSGEPLVQWRSMRNDQLWFETCLSARQLKSAQNMVHANVSGWLMRLQDRVRALITGSRLPDHDKTVLYRINARSAWWMPHLELPWLTDEDRLVPVEHRWVAATPDVVWLAVDPRLLTLARRLVKHAQQQVRFPNLTRVNTLTLDGIVAQAATAHTATQQGRVDYWVKVATLVRGKPVQVPLRANPRFAAELDRARDRGGKLCAAIQLHRTGSGVEVSLITDQPDTAPRTSGALVGVDFGFSSALFATSQGQLLGRAMLARLRELDAVLEPLAADLQRRGVALKTDPAYRALQQRIGDFVANEVGRLLNRLADTDIRELAVERLDFRGGGLSRRMNRLCTRTGRRVLKGRLQRLTERHGITVIAVPAPYSSQQCSGCGYVHKTNRKSQTRFVCGFCGKKLHADVNASRTVASRRSRPLPHGTGPRSRGNTRRLLDSDHRHRWNLPAQGAVHGITGARGRSPTKSCVT